MEWNESVYGQVGCYRTGVIRSEVGESMRKGLISVKRDAQILVRRLH